MLLYYLSEDPLMLVEKIGNVHKIVSNFSDPKSRTKNFTGDVRSLILLKEHKPGPGFHVQLPNNSKLVGLGSRGSDKVNVYRILGSGRYGVYSSVRMPDTFSYKPKKPLILNNGSYQIFEWVSEATNEFISSNTISKNLITGWNVILSLKNLTNTGITKLEDRMSRSILKQFRDSWLDLYYNISISLPSKWPVYTKTMFPNKYSIPAPATALLSSLEYDAVICDGIENNLVVLLPQTTP